MKGFLRLYTVDPGFEKQNKLTMRISLPGDRYGSTRQAASFFQETLDRFEQLPGVSSASMISHLPMSRSNWTSRFSIEGEDPDTEGRMASNRRAVSPGYFADMGIPLLKGRYLDERDREGAPPVALINELFAESLWPGEDPLGKRIAFSYQPSPEDWIEIVGVVGNVRQAGFNRNIARCVYRPMAQEGRSSAFFVLNTAGDPLGMVESARRAVWTVDADLPLYQILSMEQVIRQRNWEEPLYAFLFGIFAVIALVLASVGVYGVVAYSVSQRTREFGIRMALGADSGAVKRLVVGQVELLGGIGVGMGLLVSFASMKVLESLLFGVRHDDLTVYAIAALVMTAVALLASYLPARRATLVDPVETLRAE